jgi:Tetratricopeptide repeat/PEGA domain
MLRAMRRLLVSLLFLVIPATASAQEHEPSDAEIAEARALFMAGQAAVDSGRWADAVESFSRAYDLSHVPAALYNLGFALRALGRHREARDAFDRLLEEHPRFDRDLRREANRYRAESAGRIARLSLSGLEESRRYVVRFDGEAVNDDGRRPLEVEGDPGAHTVTVRAPGFNPFVWEGTLTDGQQLTVDVDMTALSSGGTGHDHDAILGNGGDGTTSTDRGGHGWVGWAIAGGILVAIGVAVIVGVVLFDNAQLQGLSDRVYEL